MHASHATTLRRAWPLGSVPGVVLLLLLLGSVVALGWLAIVKTEGRAALVSTAERRSAQVADLTTALTRSGNAGEGTQADVILATPTFFRLTNRRAEGAELGADRALVFVANESVHYGSLAPKFAPVLRVDGTSLRVPTEVRVLTDAVHHRTSVLVYGDVPAGITDEPHGLELLLPQSGSAERATLFWDTPIAYPERVQQPSALSLGLLLSLGAGLLAAISPCLLQLTAFYLPTLAGVSLGASGNGTATAPDRSRLLKTASLFVLGFAIPYTAGGALMGGLGQTLAGSEWLTPTGPVARLAGVAMIGMAGLVAYRARAPLVCRLPLPATVRQSERLSVLAPFLSGFAIATGCLACFGGAILGVLLVYAGILGSPLLGGLAMLVFSIGLAVPFLLAAAGFSWLLPAVGKLQRAGPAVALASGAGMLFFGLTMATGNFHVVSGWLYQHLPLA